MASKHFIAILHSWARTDIDTHRCIELKSVTTGSGFRRTEHHADLLSELVDENSSSVGTRDSSGELTHGLWHQSGLKTDIAVTHVPLNLTLGRKSRYRVDNKDVDSRWTDQLFRNFKSLLTIVRLRYEQIVDIHPKLLSIETVKCMFGINYRRNTTRTLSLGYGMDGKSSLTARFRTENLNDTPTRIAAYTQSIVESDRTGRNNIYILHRFITKLHYSTLAIILLNGSHSCWQSLGLSLSRVNLCLTLLFWNFFLCHMLFYLYILVLQ